MKYLLLTARYGFCIFPNEAPLKGVLIKPCALSYSCSQKTQIAYQRFYIIIKPLHIFIVMIHSWMCFICKCEVSVSCMQKMSLRKGKKQMHIDNI